MSSKKDIRTRTSHVGRKHRQSRLVNVPPFRGSTVLLDDTSHMRSPRGNPREDYRYGLKGSPTHSALIDLLCDLSGAEECQLHPSGLAAVWNPLMACMKPGGLVVASDSIYEPARRAIEDVVEKFSGQAIFHADPTPPSVGELPQKPTIVYCESPGSLTFEIQDLASWVSLAKESDAISMIDNTWATPLGLDTLGLGFDIDIQALTKYPSGHSDVLMGATLASGEVAKKLNKHHHISGMFASPDDVYLVSRGLRTMPHRLAIQDKHGLMVASWLEEHPKVATVYHPGLPSHPQHDLYQQYFTAGSGLFSFVLAGADFDAACRFTDRLEFFGIGYSWGGFESLCLPVAPEAIARRGYQDYPEAILRLHVGLESVDDLIEDLSQSLDAHRPAK